jgi:hypothetical protein
MNRWVAGGIALSWVATRYQDGIVFHAGSSELLVGLAQLKERHSAWTTVRNEIAFGRGQKSRTS